MHARDEQPIDNRISFSTKRFFTLVENILGRPLSRDEAQNLLSVVNKRLRVEVSKNSDKSFVRIRLDLDRLLNIHGSLQIVLHSDSVFAIAEGLCELEVRPVNDDGSVTTKLSDDNGVVNVMYGGAEPTFLEGGKAMVANNKRSIREDGDNCGVKKIKRKLSNEFREVLCAFLVIFCGLNLLGGVWTILSAGARPGTSSHYSSALTRMLQSDSIGENGLIKQVYFEDDKKTYTHKKISGPTALFANEVGEYGVESMRTLEVDGRIYDAEMIKEDFADEVLWGGELDGAGKVEGRAFDGENYLITDYYDEKDRLVCTFDRLQHRLIVADIERAWCFSVFFTNSYMTSVVERDIPGVMESTINQKTIVSTEIVRYLILMYPKQCLPPEIRYVDSECKYVGISGMPSERIKIYYTTDGSTPTRQNSILYDNVPFMVHDDTIITAVACRSDLENPWEYQSEVSRMVCDDKFRGEEPIQESMGRYADLVCLDTDDGLRIDWSAWNFPMHDGHPVKVYCDDRLCGETMGSSYFIQMDRSFRNCERRYRLLCHTARGTCASTTFTHTWEPLEVTPSNIVCWTSGYEGQMSAHVW